MRSEWARYAMAPAKRSVNTLRIGGLSTGAPGHFGHADGTSAIISSHHASSARRSSPWPGIWSSYHAAASKSSASAEDSRHSLYTAPWQSPQRLDGGFTLPEGVRSSNEIPPSGGSARGLVIATTQATQVAVVCGCRHSKKDKRFEVLSMFGNRSVRRAIWRPWRPSPPRHTWSGFYKVS